MKERVPEYVFALEPGQCVITDAPKRETSTFIEPMSTYLRLLSAAARMRSSDIIIW